MPEQQELPPLDFRSATMKKLTEGLKIPVAEEFFDDRHFWYLVERQYHNQRGRIPKGLGTRIDRHANLAQIRSLAIQNALEFAGHYVSLEKEAATDGLTGASNRRALNNFLLDLLSHRRRGEADVIIMLDVDRLKSFNDQYGHVVGDRVLKELVSLIREDIRGIDFLARYGGEEFMLVMPGIDAGVEDWKKIIFDRLEKLREAVEKKLKKRVRMADGKELKEPVTASFGVMFADDSLTVTNLEELDNRIYQPVDELLYQAKNSGRNRVYSHDFHPS